MSNTIQIAINENNLIKNIGNIFSETETVIYELLQNAQRAGADTVRLTYEKSENSLIVQDNGSGIEDFQSLFTIAQSNWSKDIDKQNPYGMGFLSALFAAEYITIRSQGQTINAKCADIINGHTTTIEQCKFAAGTVIELHGLKRALSQFIDRIENSYSSDAFAGQSLNIEINGKQMHNAYSRIALDSNCEYMKSSFEYGVIYTFKHAFCDRYHLYLQGTEIKQETYRLHRDHIIHLNDDVPARMPDRYTLLNKEEVIKSVNDAIASNLHKTVVTRVMSMSHEELAKNPDLFKLVEKYYPEHLNGITWLPAKCFIESKILDLTLNSDLHNVNTLSAGFAYSKEKLDGCNIVLEPEFDEDCSALLRSYITHVDNVLVVNGNYINGNSTWFNWDSVTSHDDIEITATYHNQRPTAYLSGFTNVGIVCCDKIELDGPFGVADVSSGFVYDDYTLYVTRNTDLREALLAICRYMDEYGSYLEDSVCSDHIEAKRIVDEALFSESEVVTEAIKRLNSTTLSKLQGNTFQVSIKDDGTIEVLNTSES